MSDNDLLLEREDGYAVVTLNRPDVMNALSPQLIGRLCATFRELEQDTAVRAVILTGAGRAFCAGLDLKELADGKGMIDELSEKRRSRINLATPFKEFGQPVIGAINGPAITGGFELALACDILIASHEARFADTHARVGIIPGSELSQKLSRLLGIYRAKEVSLTGNFIDAQQALEWGLVNRVVSSEELLPTCYKIAEDIISCPRDMIIKYKRLIDDGFHMAFGDALELERKTNYEHFQTVQAETIAQRRADVIKRGREQT